MASTRIGVYAPIAGWISVILVIFFAAGIGWSVSMLGYVTRCRSQGFLHLVGFVTGLVAL